MPNPLNLSDAAALIDVSIQQIWLKGTEKHSVYYDQYYNVETGVVDYTLKDGSLSGLAFAGRVVENAAITASSPVQGFTRTYTQIQYGVLLSFTKAMWFFGIKKRKLEDITNEARKACEDKREQLCADRLDNSFSTSYTVVDISGNFVSTITGGDGLAFASAAHTREDGGASWSNRVTDGSTVNMDFEYDALKAAHRTAALQVGPTGKPINVSLDTFVCSRGFAVHNRATEVLGAINRGYIAGSADRDGPFMAPVSSGIPNYKIIALPWIQTNTSYWWMFDSSFKNSRYGLQYKESQPLELEGPNVVFRTGEIQYKATLWFDIGHNDARGWVASKNTNAA